MLAGRSLCFSYSTGKTNFANEHIRFTSCRNCRPHVRQDGLAPGGGGISDAISDRVGKK